MGSRFNLNLAYIAGFLDGDGSLMLQLKSRSDTTRGVRFMATICLYQDTRHAAPLLWMQKVLKWKHCAPFIFMELLRLMQAATKKYIITFLIY